MAKALPQRDTAGESSPPAPEKPYSIGSRRVIRKIVSENAVVVVARRGCCMCHVVKLLLRGHGVDPCIYDVDEKNEADVNRELSRMKGLPEFPAVFVGGKLFGGLEDIMGAHISGDLVPRLRAAKALWL